MNNTVNIVARALQEMPFLLTKQHFARTTWNTLTSKFNPHLRNLAESVAARDPIQCFWSGGPLPAMARLGLSSMLKQGHPVTLYTYDPIITLLQDVPQGIRVADASSIVARPIYDHCLAKSEIRYFSDIFRYAVLHELGGWWLDTDIVLLRPLAYESDHVFSMQWSGIEQGHVCVGDVMRAPKGSLHMRNLYQTSIHRVLDGERLEFGAVGPHLLSEYILDPRREDLLRCILSPTHFNAIDWMETHLLLAEGSSAFDLVADSRVDGIHLWGKTWAEKELDFDSQPKGSLLGYLKNITLNDNYLNALAINNRSDKGSIYDQRYGHNYAKIYHNFFQARSLQPLRLLEIGLCRGRVEGWSQDQVPSLRMWLEYFPNARIVGADIEDFSWFNEPRAKVYRVDQGDRTMLSELAHCENDFDIIIDDASHASVHQQITMGVLFSKLKPGGLYVIEDLDWQPPEIPAEQSRLTKDILIEASEGKPFHSNMLTAEENKLIAGCIDEIFMYDSVSELLGRRMFGGLAIIRKK